MKNLISTLAIILFSFFAFSQEVILLEDSLLYGHHEMEFAENVNVIKDSRLDILIQTLENRYRNSAYHASRNTSPKNASGPKGSGISGVETFNKEPVRNLGETGKRSSKKVSGYIVTMKGYRIVIYNGNNRNRATETKQQFMRRYSSVPSYLSYTTPNFKIKVGDFETKGQANTFLRKIKGVFPSSFVVPDIVRVKKINIQ